MNPLVTIAVPTIERLAYLKEAVTSALAQEYERIEVLIGDNGQIESIRAWANAVGDRRVRYQRNPRDLGLAGNWNALAAAARGEFMVLIGDDDRLLPRFVGRLIRESTPGVNVLFANHFLINDRGEHLEAESRVHTRRYHRDRLPAGEIADAESCVWRNSVPMSAAIIRTDDARRLKFKEDLNTPEIEFFLRLALEGGRFVFVPEYLAEYRVHAQSLTAAGLRSEALAKYLIPMSASPVAEPLKRAFMRPLLADAVGRCLQQGNRDLARAYLASEYYPHPRWLHMRGLVQGLCAGLPVTLGRPLYRAVQHVKSVTRGVRKAAKSR